MELGTQIKKYRNELALSQDELAEKIYVSRQSISNWENDKTYPDIKSLLLLSEVFSVSLDILIKGDIDTMKKEIDGQEYAKFKRDSAIFTVLFLLAFLLPIPLVMLFRWPGLVGYLMFAMVQLYYGHRVEMHMQNFDIQTYKEIMAFTEGKSLSEIEKEREIQKRPYQKALYVAGSAVLMVVVCGIMLWLFQWIGR